MKYSIFMQKNKGRRGRPATGRNEEDYAPVRSFRLGDDIMARIDAWSAAQDDAPGRSETIRRLVELGLSVAKPREPGAHKGAAKAKAIAEEKIAPLIDPNVPEEEQAKRKRRLLKGPSEFQEMRADQPKSKAGR